MTPLIGRTYRGINKKKQRKVETMSCGDGKTQYVYYTERFKKTLTESCCRIETFSRWALKEVLT